MKSVKNRIPSRDSDPVGVPSRRKIWINLLLYPSHTLPTAAAPVLVGAALAWRDDRFAPLIILTGFLASWLIHVGGVFVDNHALLSRYPHIREHPELNGAVRDGKLKLPVLKLVIAACFILPALTLPFFLRIVGWPVLVIGVVGMSASFAYAGGPKPYVRSGLADPIFLFMFGVFAVAATYYVSALAMSDTGPFETLADMPLSAFIIGLPVGLLVTNVMIIDDIRDHDFDREKGWRTTPVRFGQKASRIEFLLFAVTAYCLPVFSYLGSGFGLPILLPLLTLPFGIRLVHTILTEKRRHALIPMTPKAAFLALGYALLLALGIVLS